MMTIVGTNKKSTDFDDKMVITISHHGFIERTSFTKIHSLTYDIVGVKTFFTRENDFVEYISLATMHSTILFFTSLGRCYWLNVSAIPENSSKLNEYTVQKLLKIEAGDNILAFIPVENSSDTDFLDSHSVVFCTKDGVVKRTWLMAFFRQHDGIIRPCINGIKAINLREGDSLLNVIITNGENELMLASSEGRAIRFNESQILMMGRASTGVRGLKLTDDKDEIVGIVPIDDNKTNNIMFVSEKGYGIRVNLEDFRATGRANLGLKVTNVTNKTGKVVAITTVSDGTDLIVFNKSGVINRIKVKDIPVKKRTTQCIKLIDKILEHDQIVCILKVNDLGKLEYNF